MSNYYYDDYYYYVRMYIRHGNYFKNNFISVLIYKKKDKLQIHIFVFFLPVLLMF